MLMATKNEIKDVLFNDYFCQSQNRIKLKTLNKNKDLIDSIEMISKDMYQYYIEETLSLENKVKWILDFNDISTGNSKPLKKYYSIDEFIDNMCFMKNGELIRRITWETLVDYYSPFLNII